MNKIQKRRYLFFVSQDYSFAVLRPLQQKILMQGDEAKWFMYGDEINTDCLHADEVRLFSIEEIIDYQPDAVFVPGNVVPSFIPGLKVEVFHGLPSAKVKKNGQLYHYIIRGMFDLYCTQGPSSTQKFQELAKQYGFFNVEETGWCKLDPLFPLEKRDENLKQKSIFFASTFSPRFSKAKILYPLILDMMKKYDFNWYITLHPKMDLSIVELYKSIDLPNVQFVESTELIESFKKSDLMLCDTSSIIYEFLTQLKPVITFQTEKDAPELINVEDIDKLQETILSVLDNLDINRENIEKSVMQFHPYIDGKSSERVLRAVEKMLERENIPKKKKPLNLIRNIRLRKELGYWKWKI
ncbi:MAG: CDP-glycerol glycerophosphotransferase family protein [Sulfurimonas sp.]|nr:CDP-glycerol glycerophosphotransferase family protein [Sulfurimonas sp.]